MHIVRARLTTPTTDNLWFFICVKGIKVRISFEPTEERKWMHHAVSYKQQTAHSSSLCQCLIYHVSSDTEIVRLVGRHRRL